MKLHEAAWSCMGLHGAAAGAAAAAGLWAEALASSWAGGEPEGPPSLAAAGMELPGMRFACSPQLEEGREEVSAAAAPRGIRMTKDLDEEGNQND